MMKPLRIATGTLTLLLVPVLAPAQTLVVDTPYVEQALHSGALVWDARSVDEYARGHIPGAVNIGFAGEIFRDPNREDPPSAAAASKIFGSAGMDVANKDVIVYTNRGDAFAYYGVRASESAVVLRQLGFGKVKVYGSSWLGYAGALSAPAEDEVFVNIGALNGRVASLQNRVKDLEAEVSRLQGAGKR